MADEYTLQIEHGDRTHHVGVSPDDTVDQLLLKSLDYFDRDPQAKGDWTLARAGAESAEEGRLVLGDPVAEQVENGERLRLIPRDADAREPSTGSY